MTDLYDLLLAQKLSGGGGGGGGGGSSYHLIASQEYDWTYTSTSEATIDTMQLPASAWTKDKMLFVKIRYLGVAEFDIFLGSDSILSNQYINAGSTADNKSFMKASYFINGSRRWVVAKTNSTVNNVQGVTAGPLSSNGLLSLKAMAGSANGLINGRCKVEVYELDWPGDSSPPGSWTSRPSAESSPTDTGKPPATTPSTTT